MINSNILNDVIDIHIHSAPDLRIRRLSDIELAKLAKKMNVKAIVIKSHIMPTVARAIIAEEVVKGIKVFGGITLNPHVGGLNPVAVETALKLGGKFVWLPTSFSENERKQQKKTDGIKITDKNGNLLPNLITILKLIKEYNAVLATGHISFEEMLLVIKKAKEIGITKIVINHPEWTTIDLDIESQRKLLEYGVYFERCYARNINGNYYKNIELNIQAIKILGYENTIIATDGGQIENPIWNEALTEIILELKKNGFTQNQIDVMTKINPAKLLDL